MQERPLNAVPAATTATPSADHVPDSQAPSKPDWLGQIRAAIRRTDVGYWAKEFPCPGPHDCKDQATLTVSRHAGGGKTSLRCSGPKDYKGDRCRPQDILKPLGLTPADLHPDADPAELGDLAEGTGYWERLDSCPLCGKDGCSLTPDGSTLICWRPWQAPEDHGGTLCECDNGQYLKVPMTLSPAIRRTKRADTPLNPIQALAPHHHLLVQTRYGLADNTIQAASLRTLEGEDLGQVLKWGRPADATKLGQAIVIPYRSRDGSLNCYAKVRPDRPVPAKDGTPRKYMGPAGEAPIGTSFTRPTPG
jgi:hypothetical protein